MLALLLVVATIVLIVVGCFVIWPILKRELADQRILYVRPKPNSMVVVTKDNSPYRVYINCNDPEIVKRLEENLAEEIKVSIPEINFLTDVCFKFQKIIS